MNTFPTHYKSMMHNYEVMFEDIIEDCHVECSEVWELIREVRNLEEFYRWGVRRV